MQAYTTLYPNQQGNYSAEQLALPLNLKKKINPKDSYWTFEEVMQEVNFGKYLKHHRGNQGYSRIRMIKAVLFAFMIGERSLRHIEALCRNDIRFMNIMNFEEPSFMAFQRLISKDLSTDIESIFEEINDILKQKDSINDRVVYIDGTKIEANANKFSFVWRKTVESTLQKSKERAAKTIEEIEALTNLRYNNDESLRSFVVKTALYCSNIMNVEFVYGRGKHKTPVQRLYDKLKSYTDKIDECLEKLEIMGTDRNSYSKTDHSATFMHMKYDYYMNTGVFKPGYNIQFGIADEYIRHIYISNDRADQKTLIPFLDSYKDRYGCLPGIVVADAGYGSYDNYMYCLTNKIDAYIKYTNYRMEKTAKFKKQQFRRENLFHEENGKIVCPNGKEFVYKRDTENRRTIYYSVSQEYECESCEGCSFKKQCTKSKGNRKIRTNVIYEELKKDAKEKLDSPAGIQLCQQRSIQSEGTFGVVKQDYNYTRIQRRGEHNVENEVYLVAIGYNLMKYHLKKLRKLLS